MQGINDGVDRAFKYDPSSSNFWIPLKSSERST